MSKSNAAQIVYSPRPDSTPEAEATALASIYALCLKKHREKENAGKPAPEPAGCDGTKLEEDSAYVSTSIPNPS